MVLRLSCALTIENTGSERTLVHAWKGTIVSYLETDIINSLDCYSLLILTKNCINAIWQWVVKFNKQYPVKRVVILKSVYPF